jgi:predicted DNA-binding protein with PD1-like motif
MTGNIIFAAEAVVTELPGDALNRVFDEPTGLKLWG